MKYLSNYMNDTERKNLANDILSDIEKMRLNKETCIITRFLIDSHVGVYIPKYAYDMFGYSEGSREPQEEEYWEDFFNEFLVVIEEELNSKEANLKPNDNVYLMVDYDDNSGDLCIFTLVNENYWE